MSDNNPVTKVGGWQRLTSRVAYENPWIKVYHEEVKTPGGTDGIYGVVHFKGTAVGVVPVDAEGNTWLVRQSRYTLNAHTWEIPEGGAKPGEPTLECAQRELAEEVGLQASEWRELGRVHLSNSVTDEGGVLYLATGISQCEQNLEPTEDIEVRKLPLREALAMVLSGEITDALSVIALLRLGLENKINVPK